MPASVVQQRAHEVADRAALPGAQRRRCRCPADCRRRSAAPPRCGLVRRLRRLRLLLQLSRSFSSVLSSAVLSGAGFLVGFGCAVGAGRARRRRQRRRRHRQRRRRRRRAAWAACGGAGGGGVTGVGVGRRRRRRLRRRRRGRRRRSARRRRRGRRRRRRRWRWRSVGGGFGRRRRRRRGFGVGASAGAGTWRRRRRLLRGLACPRTPSPPRSPAAPPAAVTRSAGRSAAASRITTCSATEIAAPRRSPGLIAGIAAGPRPPCRGCAAARRLLQPSAGAALPGARAGAAPAAAPVGPPAAGAWAAPARRRLLGQQRHLGEAALGDGAHHLHDPAIGQVLVAAHEDAPVRRCSARSPAAWRPGRAARPAGPAGRCCPAR